MVKSNKKAPEKRKDHWIPKTYLKHFIDLTYCLPPKIPNQVRLYLKKNPALCVLADPDTICREIGGDYHPYFKGSDSFEDGRPIDEYLKLIENPYNQALRDFENGNYNEDAKACLALNIARIRCWTPKRKELVQAPWDNHILAIKQSIIDDLKNNPDSEKIKKGIEILKQKLKNEEITAQTLLEDFENPNIGLQVDPHFSNRSLIKVMCEGGCFYYCKSWSIIHNETSRPFITSDNPVCILEYPINSESNIMLPVIYVPLTPKLAILIHVASPYVGSVIKEIEATEEGVKKLNTTIVKFADNLIIANMEADWIKSKVLEFKDFQEIYNEKVVASGIDENGEYVIIQKGFNVN